MVVVSVVAALIAGLLAVASPLVESARARTAADAAALAGAVDGRAAAESVAGANGAVLLGWHEEPGVVPGTLTVTVEVRLGASTARARATTDP